MPVKVKQQFSQVLMLSTKLQHLTKLSQLLLPAVVRYNLNMKKSLIVSLVILVLVGIVFLRFLSPEDTWLCENGEWIKHGNPSQAQPATSCVGLNDKQSDSDKIIVEQYIRDNVKIIVPEKPVLGGSWYITSVNINPSLKTGTMTYEDGHIQGNKSFSYIRNIDEFY